jgi:hypothetical protein
MCDRLACLLLLRVQRCIVVGKEIGQRKILFASFKKKLVREAKVCYEDGFRYGLPNLCI